MENKHKTCGQCKMLIKGKCKSRHYTDPTYLNRPRRKDQKICRGGFKPK